MNGPFIKIVLGITLFGFVVLNSSCSEKVRGYSVDEVEPVLFDLLEKKVGIEIRDLRRKQSQSGLRKIVFRNGPLPQKAPDIFEITLVSVKNGQDTKVILEAKSGAFQNRDKALARRWGEILLNAVPGELE